MRYFDVTDKIYFSYLHVFIYIFVDTFMIFMILILKILKHKCINLNIKFFIKNMY